MSYTVTTSVGTLTGGGISLLYKVVQGNVLVGFQKECEEWALIKRLKKFDLNFSARNVSAPIDITRQGSGSHIAEASYESNPKTVAPKELTFTWGNYNDRYSFSLTSLYMDKTARAAEIERQARYQTLKLTEGMVNRIGYAFYGISTGTMCYTSTVQTATTGAYALTSGFGNTSITDPTYLATMFTTSDYVALVRGGTLVSNANVGQITTISNTSGLTIVWPGSVISAANDAIVFANNSPVPSTATITHTDYNHCPNGLIDFLTTASVQSLSSATDPLWAAAWADTNGAALTGTRLMKGQDLINNLGGGSPNLLIWSQGVRRNVHQNTFAQVKFDDPLNMQVIGSVKTGGYKLHTSRKVPPGFAIMADDSALFSWTMVPMPSDSMASLDGVDNANVDKLQDQNAKVASFDFPYAFPCTNRGKLAYWSGLTES